MVRVTFQRVYFVSQPLCWGVQGPESGAEFVYELRNCSNELDDDGLIPIPSSLDNSIHHSLNSFLRKFLK